MNKINIAVCVCAKIMKFINFQGVKYLGSSLEINISTNNSYIRCVYLNEEIPLQIHYPNGTIFAIAEDLKCECKI